MQMKVIIVITLLLYILLQQPHQLVWFSSSSFIPSFSAHSSSSFQFLKDTTRHRCFSVHASACRHPSLLS